MLSDMFFCIESSTAASLFFEPKRVAFAKMHERTLMIQAATFHTRVQTSQEIRRIDRRTNHTPVYKY